MRAQELFLKDPVSSRFVGGDVAEAEALFGSPLPTLPRPEEEDGQELYLVRFHPRLRNLLGRFLQSLLGQISGDVGPMRVEGVARTTDEYESAVVNLLSSMRRTDRRQGLTNLFWLAHSLDAALLLRDLERKQPPVRKLKYSLHPLLASFYRRVEQLARRDDNADALDGGENPSLVDALVDDGFAFTEASLADLDFNQFLASNKRYRLPAEVFFEIQALLQRETERRLRENDRGLVQRAQRHVPRLRRDQYQSRAGIARLALNAQIMTYLLADPWSTAGALMALPKLKAECERRRPAEIMDVFLELVAGMKRFEVLAHLRERVRLVDAFVGERAIDDRISRGSRVFEFGDAAHVLNSAVNATVMFLDLRGFTRTSEGHISEGDLTRALYTVFDPFTAIVRRSSGTVDKFLGDGMMITFGTERSDPQGALNAVRCAIQCQETLARLRREGQTHFHMGIAIHYGRVYLARFLGEDGSVHATVIGRNVNLAGRMSSAGSKPVEEDEGGVGPSEEPQDRQGVLVGEDGTLDNTGIALSQDTLAQLQAQLPLRHSGREWEYFDEQIGRSIVIRYAGDAKFKGVRSTFPLYDVGFEG